ncbi:MAG: TRIC cation channel family protein [Lachnospiraceae bacterium]|nr:TRIC cation channel family protein [Lachnospiraceae bacterium]
MFSSVVLIFELIGTVAFSVSGAMVGIRKKMDIFGILILGLCTAVGGGVIRDLVLGNTPPVSFVQPVYAAVAAISALITCLPFVGSMIEKRHGPYDRLMLIMDSAGLGIFTVVGVRAAYVHVTDPSLYLLIFVGVITGVGGGILRDVLAGETPFIFSKQFYACASIIGALVCVIIWDAGTHIATMQLQSSPFQVAGEVLTSADQIHSIAMAGGAFTVFVLRLLAAHFRWNLPRPWWE